MAEAHIPLLWQCGAEVAPEVTGFTGTTEAESAEQEYDLGGPDIMTDDSIYRTGSGDAGGSRVPAKQWHCRVNGQVYGPISTEQLVRWAKERRLSPTDSIEGGDAKWVPAATISGLYSEAEAAAALEHLAAEKAAAAEKADTPNSAEDIIRKMRPDLFGQRRPSALGPGGKSDDLQARGGGSSAATTEVAEAVKARTAKKVKEKKERSVGFDFAPLDAVREIPYSISDAFRSAILWIAEHIPRWMLRWTVTHTVVAAFVLVVAGAYLGIAHYPETNEDLYIHDELIAIHAEYREYLNGDKSGDVEAFRADAAERIDRLIDDLQDTSSIFTRQRQHLLWAARDNLLPFLADQEAKNKETDFKRHMAEVKRVWADNARRERMRAAEAQQ